MINEKTAHIFLNLAPQIGPQRLAALKKMCGNAVSVLSLSAHDIAQVQGFTLASAHAVRKILDDESLLEKELALIERHGAHVVLNEEPEYPELLRHIYASPQLLYVKGKTVPANLRTVALVGTRRPSIAGKMIARRIAEELTQYNVITVSGGARGIDTEIHTATCAASGHTIAVLGCGLGIVYPPENRKLFERIAENGMVMSEFSMLTKPDKINFPQRNRIISGMSWATVVVEAPLKSGALITAHYATEQGRDVLTVPIHPLYASSEGNQWLLRQGALPVASGSDIVEDVFSHFEIKPAKTVTHTHQWSTLDEKEKKVVTAMSINPVPIDYLLDATNLEPGALMQLLLNLQLKGIIEELPGKRFICCESDLCGKERHS